MKVTGKRKEEKKKSRRLDKSFGQYRDMEGSRRSRIKTDFTK